MHMRKRMHTCMHACMHTCMHACAYMHTCKHARTHACMHACARVHTHANLCRGMRARGRRSMRACICACTRFILCGCAFLQYLPHPEHLKVKELQSPLLESILVVDFTEQIPEDCAADLPPPMLARYPLSHAQACSHTQTHTAHTCHPLSAIRWRNQNACYVESYQSCAQNSGPGTTACGAPQVHWPVKHADRAALLRGPFPQEVNDADWLVGWQARSLARSRTDG